MAVRRTSEWEIHVVIPRSNDIFSPPTNINHTLHQYYAAHFLLSEDIWYRVISEIGTYRLFRWHNESTIAINLFLGGYLTTLSVIGAIQHRMRGLFINCNEMIAEFSWRDWEKLQRCIGEVEVNKNKLRGLSPQASYTDRATAACRRS
jgi:hypothetical protein